MSVARITTVTFESNEAADIAAAAYVPNAPSDFPEAEQLIAVKSEGNVNISVTYIRITKQWKEQLLQKIK